jgi:hypothetical protein
MLPIGGEQWNGQMKPSSRATLACADACYVVQLAGMKQRRWLRGAASEFLFHHPRILFGGLRFAAQTASLADMKLFISLTKRAEWAPLIYDLLPLFDLEFGAPEPINASDIALASRIIAAYRLSGRADPNMQLVETGSTWSNLEESNYANLIGLLRSGDDEALASLFSGLFRTKIVDGYTMGTWFESRPHRWWIWGAAILASIASLAEYSGFFSVECVEQGKSGSIFQNGTGPIFDKLDKSLAVRIDAPRIGASRGIRVSGRFISRELCNQVYTACQIIASIDNYLGGGGPGIGDRGRLWRTVLLVEEITKGATR